MSTRLPPTHLVDSLQSHFVAISEASVCVCVGFGRWMEWCGDAVGGVASVVSGRRLVCAAKVESGESDVKGPAPRCCTICAKTKTAHSATLFFEGKLSRPDCAAGWNFSLQNTFLIFNSYAGVCGT